MLDVVYNPLHTALFMQAEALGIPCSCGLPMLAAQARAAAELFSGTGISDQKMESVLTDLEKQLRNIVLIGMPGCGKTTIGEALAHRLDRKFMDLDALIEDRAGKSIPQIFAEDGEDAFRDLESRIVREAGAETGTVISTGGGVVTRAENYAPLHQNGVIIHLIRRTDLLPTEGRPISRTTDLSALQRIRDPLYRQFADLTVDNNGTVEETLENIRKELIAG